MRPDVLRHRQRALPLLIVGLLLIVVAPLTVMLPTWASGGGGHDPLWLPVNPTVEQLWRSTDGEVASGSQARGWLWGPTVNAMSVEPDVASPNGSRQLAWFDKGRLEIADPSADPSNPWFATGGLLVSEMVSGAAQPSGANLGPATIPVVGDLEQASAVTYATFAKLNAAVNGAHEINAATLTAARATGQPQPNAAIHAVLRPNGSVDPNGASAAQVIVGGYDDLTGHNIAAPFAAFDAALGYPATWLLGHALSEPYWVDATVAGTPKRVLVQLFERRTLTYTADNPSNWQVESGNVGVHYRLWRGLSQTTEPALAGLASLEPGGEELVAAAASNGVDPYLLVAIAETHASVALSAKPSEAAARIALAAARQPDVRALLVDFFSTTADLYGAAPEPGKLADAVIARRDALQATYAPSTTPGARQIDENGVAAIYPAGYTTSWWERSLNWSGSWGGALAGWATDSNSYYCTHPGYLPGERLRVVASTVTIDCTIGARPPATDLSGWSAGSVIQVNDAAAAALRLHAGATAAVHVVTVTAANLPPNLPPNAAVVTVPGVGIGSGQAAYYSPTYDRAWWEWAMRYYDNMGQVTPGWQYDPNGNYCVHPNYIPGDRLRLIANGVSLDCTIGDTVADQDVTNWRARFVVELAWPTFKALSLNSSNQVEVYYLGPAPKRERIAPPAPSTPEPTPTEPPPVAPAPTQPPAPAPTQPPVETPTPEPTPTVAPAITDVPTQTPVTPAPAGTPEPTATVTPEPTATGTPPATEVVTPTVVSDAATPTETAVPATP